MSTHGYITVAGQNFGIYLRSDAGFTYMSKHLNEILLEIFPDKDTKGWSVGAFSGEIIPAMIEWDKRMYARLVKCSPKGRGNFSDSTRAAYAKEAKEATREKGKYHLSNHVQAFHTLYEIDFTTKLIHLFEPAPKAGWGTVYQMDQYPKKMRHVSSFPWFASPVLYFTPAETNEEGTYYPAQSSAMGRKLMKYYGAEGRKLHYFDRMDEKDNVNSESDYMIDAAAKLSIHEARAVSNVTELMEIADEAGCGL
jgi:hypothetical protein